MKFAHMADVHIDSWRDPKLKALSGEAFTKAIKMCIENKVDFVLIAGDLFHTALPSIDATKLVVKQLKQLKDRHMGVYVIPGSHDFSPSGKTMMDVLEEAGLLINVVKGSIEEGKLKLKFTIDPKTGAKITGLLGKRGMLDRVYYENLIKEPLEQEQGFKIFMFHTALSEFKPKTYELMESSPLSLLPKQFQYYAGGHVHYIFETIEEDYGTIVYPGPLFPANFQELAELKQGGFYFCEDGKLSYQQVIMKNVVSLDYDATNKTVEQIQDELLAQATKTELYNTIVLLRISGTMQGKPSAVDFTSLFTALYAKGAYFVMKNAVQLTGDRFEIIKMALSNSEDMEDTLIREHLGQVKVDFDEGVLAKKLLRSLHAEKHEGERQYEFEERIKRDMDELVN